MREKQMQQSAPTTGTLSADDRFEIHQLIEGEYFLYEDNGKFEPWAELFTTDGSFFPAGKTPVFGRKSLVEFARNRWETRPEVRNWRHVVTNIVIRATAEGAEADCYQTTVEKVGSEYRVRLLSRKADELRREDGKWRFYSRRAFPLWT
jgi:hypothetical protein